MNKEKDTEKYDSGGTFDAGAYMSSVIYHVAHMCELSQNALLKQYGVTHQQTRMLAYVYARQGMDVFQRDLEAEFGLSSATVTQQLNILERKGFLLRLPYEQDKRAKKLVVTELARKYHNIFYKTLNDVDEVLCWGFTDVEKTLFRALLKKADDNMAAKF